MRVSSTEERLELIDEGLDRAFEQLDHLVDWTHTHDEEHVNEDKRMNLLLTQLTEHDTNHHGRASTIKQGTWVAGALTLIYAVAELLRQFLL